MVNINAIQMKEFTDIKHIPPLTYLLNTWCFKQQWIESESTFEEHNKLAK